MTDPAISADYDRAYADTWALASGWARPILLTSVQGGLALAGLPGSNQDRVWGHIDALCDLLRQQRATNPLGDRS